MKEEREDKTREDKRRPDKTEEKKTRQEKMKENSELVTLRKSRILPPFTSVCLNFPPLSHQEHCMDALATLRESRDGRLPTLV